MNRICLIGRITKDPEVKTTNNGKEYCNFTIAVQRLTKDANGDIQADFIYCIAWNQTAKFMANYIKKGYNLAIDGRLQINQYQKDGQNVTSAQVVCDSVNSLTTRAEVQGQSKTAYQQKPNSYSKQAYNNPKANPSNNQAQAKSSYNSYDNKNTRNFEPSNVNVIDDDLPF